MGRTWTAEDAARRLLFLFSGRKPGDTLHISDISHHLGSDGELVTLLPAGFEQPLEFPGNPQPSARP